MSLFRRALIISALILTPACAQSNLNVLDGSSESNFSDSMERIRKTLAGEKQHQFINAVIATAVDIQKHADGPIDLNKERREALHGLTAEQVIERAKRLPPYDYRTAPIPQVPAPTISNPGIGVSSSSPASNEAQ